MIGPLELTSTVPNFYTALKIMSKKHFYESAAPERVLAVGLSALLPPRSGEEIFSDLYPPKGPRLQIWGLRRCRIILLNICLLLKDHWSASGHVAHTDLLTPREGH